LIAAAAYIDCIIAAQLLLPAVDEVPDGFPAPVLWDFRIASLGMQFVMWSTIGLLFGALTERATAARRPFLVKAHAPAYDSKATYRLE
jgi:predicted cobalt transporter CbtA